MFIGFSFCKKQIYGDLRLEPQIKLLKKTKSSKNIDKCDYYTKDTIIYVRKIQN